jgi:hypothetical protein
MHQQQLHPRHIRRRMSALISRRSVARTPINTSRQSLCFWSRWPSPWPSWSSAAGRVVERVCTGTPRYVATSIGVHSGSGLTRFMAVPFTYDQLFPCDPCSHLPDGQMNRLVQPSPRNLSERHRRPMQPRDRHLDGCVRGRAEGSRPGDRRQRAHADLASPKGQPAVLPGFSRRWVRAVWRRPVPAVRTAMARALRLPASTTRRLARVMAV